MYRDAYPMKVLKSTRKTSFLNRILCNGDFAEEEKYTDLQNLGTLHVNGGDTVKGITFPQNKAPARGATRPMTGTAWRKRRHRVHHDNSR